MTAHIHKTAMSPNMKPKVYLHNVVTSCVHWTEWFVFRASNLK